MLCQVHETKSDCGLVLSVRNLQLCHLSHIVLKKTCCQNYHFRSHNSCICLTSLTSKELQNNDPKSIKLPPVLKQHLTCRHKTWFKSCQRPFCYINLHILWVQILGKYKWQATDWILMLNLGKQACFYWRVQRPDNICACWQHQ